jgi:hypothetical protein
LLPSLVVTPWLVADLTFLLHVVLCIHLLILFSYVLSRDGATRSVLVLRGPGLVTLWSLTTLTSSEFTTV